MASLTPNTRFVTSIGVAIVVAIFLITGTWTVAGRLSTINEGQSGMRSEFQAAVAKVNGQLSLMNANRWTRDDMAKWASEFATQNGAVRVPQVQRAYVKAPIVDPDGG